MESPVILGGLVFLVLVLLLLTSLWIAVAIAMVGALGFLILRGDASLIAFVPYNTADSFILTAVPLFIFMGEVLVQCRASEMLYRGITKWLAWAPGGLLHSNIGACAVFASVSGSSVATAATIGTVAIPALRERGYDTRLSLGSLAAGGTLGILIPPSITMVIYGMLAETSVGRLFAGGVIPGIMLSGMFISYIAIRVALNPSLAPKEASFSLKAAVVALKDFWPAIVLAVIVLGGIFAGLYTPTEAAAIGSSTALIIALALRRLSWRVLRESLTNALETTCMVMFLVVGSYIFATLLSMLNMPQALVIMVKNAELSRWGILAFIYLLYLVLGCFIDCTSALIITAGVVIPLVEAAGFDLVWFGVVFVVLVEIGLLTPPMGINVFVIQGISKAPLNEIFAAVWPFFSIMILAIALFTVWPDIILWLPNLLFGP